MRPNNKSLLKVFCKKYIDLQLGKPISIDKKKYYSFNSVLGKLISIIACDYIKESVDEKQNIQNFSYRS